MERKRKISDELIYKNVGENEAFSKPPKEETK